MSPSILLALSATFTGAAERPNFIFLFADDQRHDALSCVQKEQGARGRYPWFQTPNMDRLAAEGVRFRNAFVVHSLCSPSRAAFLTGRYNHANGIVNNRTAFPPDSVTHASLLRAAGYCTGYVGKWHMGSQPDRPGFDWFASYTGHSRYESSVFLVNGVKTPTEGWIDDRAADYAIRFLEKDRVKGKPFSLVVGFKSPHGPFTPPPRLKDRFAGEKARAVPNLGLAPAFNPDLGKELKRPTEDLVPVNLSYFRCIAGIDQNLGRVLDALDRLKLSDNTVVIYSSDNGFYHGEHGLADKRSAYDESLRIPFLVRYPKSGARNVVRDEMVLNIDLAPTLLDLAGLPAPKEMHGKSWKALLSGKKPRDPSAFRAGFFFEYFRENGPRGAPARNPGGYNTPTLTGVRTLTHKLIRYADHDAWTELFDLSADPYETKNLANDPAQTETRQKLQAEHDRLAKELGYSVPKHVPRQAPQPPAPVKAGWVLDYDFRKDDGDQVHDLTGQGADGTARNAPLSAGRGTAKARQFTGDGHIEVARTKGLACAEVPFVVEVTAKAEGKDGVLVARGGATNGFSVYLQHGNPTFALRASGRLYVAAGTEAVVGRWVTLTAAVADDGKLTLNVDGKLAAEAAGRLIPREPNDGLQVGADLGSPVEPEAAKAKFCGRIERVRIHRGAVPGK